MMRISLPQLLGSLSTPWPLLVLAWAGIAALGILIAMAYHRQERRPRRIASEDDEETMNGVRRVREVDLMKGRVGLGVVVQIVVYVITIVLAYSALDKRISSNEMKYDRIAEDVKEIKADVKKLVIRP